MSRATARFQCAACNGRDLGAAHDDGHGFAKPSLAACPIHGRAYRYVMPADDRHDPAPFKPDSTAQVAIQ
jgi:hypothetical protein